MERFKGGAAPAACRLRFVAWKGASLCGAPFFVPMLASAKSAPMLVFASVRLGSKTDTRLRGRVKALTRVNRVTSVASRIAV